MGFKVKHQWTFPARFRKNAFGWRASHLAARRIKEAVSEIKKAARKDAVLGGGGAILFLEKVSPALEHIDSSSGAIGTAVNNAIEALVPIVAEAHADEALRDKWLDRLWQAVEADDIPYIELLPDYWGLLCVTSDRASHWADNFIDSVRMSWSQGPNLHGYFNGTSACLSALFQAGRHEEILSLLNLIPYKHWGYRQWGVKALGSMGKKGEAIRYAEDSRGLNEDPVAIAEACEAILHSSGMTEEAYTRYAIEANQKMTYLATFRAIAKKYPHKKSADLLHDLVASTPGDEGKWFAAAKSAGLYNEAIELANHRHCDPRTLIRAARDMETAEPRFAIEAGMAALRWMVEGYGYEIIGTDVWAAYDHTMKAAENVECRPETLERIRRLVASKVYGENFVRKILGRTIGLNP